VVIQVIQKILCFFLSIEIFGLLVRDKKIVLIDLKIEVWWCFVVIEKDMSKDVDVLAKTFWVRHPNELHLIGVYSSLLVLAVEASKEPSIEAHLSKETSVRVRVTEWIDLPADGWLYTEFFKNKLVANHHVVDHVVVYWTSLVVHRPASIDKLKLTAPNKLPHLGLHVLVLLVPPHLKELHLNFHEGLIGIGKQ
jgi:hypothetical protein